MAAEVAVGRRDEATLRVEGARLGYGATMVLEAVDLEVCRGEFWFLLGPNGCGKTTLLRAILGLLEPQAGRVWRHPSHAARGRIGFVPQHCALSAALPTTIREFVSLGAIGGDRPRKGLAADLDWALERGRLAGMADRDYWSLSGGQRQRALVARALVRRPSLLVLDEATEGMDLRSQEDFLAAIDALHREDGATVLFVTHHVDIAIRHATHVALIDGGRVLSGPRSEVLRPGTVAAAFGAWGATFAERLREAAGEQP